MSGILNATRRLILVGLTLVGASLATSSLAQEAAAAETQPHEEPVRGAVRRVAVETRAADGATIVGEVLLPASPQVVPVVMLISGTGRQARDFIAFSGRYRPHRDMAEALLAADIGVIWFDERNTGASTGDHRTATAQDLREDAWGVFQKAREVPGVDPDAMFIFGGSEGAVFAMQLAGQKTGLAGIAIAGAPYRSGREMTRDQVRAENPVQEGEDETAYAARLETLYEADVAFQASRPSLAAMLDYDGAAVASQVKTPVLILEGAEDWQVQPPAGSNLACAMRMAGNDRVRHEYLRGVGHLMTPNPPGVVDYEALPDLKVDARVTATLAQWVHATAPRPPLRSKP